MEKKLRKNLAYERSLRLKLLRKKYCLTVQQLAYRSKIKEQTIYSWESQKNCLTMKGAQKIVECLQPNDPQTLLHWILDGEEVSDRSGQQESGQTLLNNDLLYFLNSRKNAVVLTYLDEPTPISIVKGDFIGGIKVFGTDIHSLLGALCIVEFKSGQTVLKHIEPGPDMVTICLKDPSGSGDVQHATLEDIQWAAKVTWLSKKEGKSS